MIWMEGEADESCHFRHRHVGGCGALSIVGRESTLRPLDRRTSGRDYTFALCHCIHLYARQELSYVQIASAQCRVKVVGGDQCDERLEGTEELPLIGPDGPRLYG